LAHYVLETIFDIVALSVIAFAVSRYHLFEVHKRLRWASSQGTIATMMAAIFSIVTLAASEYLVDQFGYLFGAAAAGLLLLGLRPLRRLADRIATRAVPIAAPIDQRGELDRLAFYQEQVKTAFGDGHLKPKELVMLDGSRQRQGITAEQASQVQTARAV
jgi:hypothetical protein